MNRRRRQAVVSTGTQRDSVRLNDPDLIVLMRLVKTGAYLDVERVAKSILARRPGQALAMKALVFSLISQARFVEALPTASECVARFPHDAENLSNLGIVESELMRWPQAVDHFQAAIGISPNDPELHRNLGGAYYRMQRWGDAIPILLKAIELHPGDYIDAVKLLAGALLNARRFEEALTCFEELLKESPSDSQALFLCIHTRLNVCRWEGLSGMIERLWSMFDERPKMLDSPLLGLSIPGTTTKRQMHIASSYAKFWLPSIVGGVRQIGKRDPGVRLRVGYISGDFKEHPVGYVLPTVIEHHDRSIVECWGISIGPNDNSPTRARFQAIFEHFLDLEDQPVHAVVDTIRGLKLDILVDLSGWTSPNRAEALAMRCAPIQVGWLGYAGSCGSRGMWDYLLGDSTVIPPNATEDYAELIAHLPYAYLPVEPIRTGETPSRDSEGLRSDSFVFCSFNSYYKFNPLVFDVWCEILRRTPNSVLWLPRASTTIALHLRHEAESRGVDQARLVFAVFKEKHSEHLARLPLADLALDPFPYNSHSTGCEILLAGVPMVSLLGETFAGRVGASLLQAAGLAELVADSAADYASIAIKLANDPGRLRELRQRMKETISDSPLADMAGFSRSLEKLYGQMFNDCAEGIKRPLLISTQTVPS